MPDVQVSAAGEESRTTTADKTAADPSGSVAAAEASPIQLATPSGRTFLVETRHIILTCTALAVLVIGTFSIGLVLGFRYYEARAAQEASITSSFEPPQLSVSEPTDDSGPTPDPTPDSVAPAELVDAKAPDAPTADPPLRAAPIDSAPLGKDTAAQKDGIALPVSLPMHAADSRAGILLQVAAVVYQDRARQLALDLQRRSFPAFVEFSQDDHLYRVQVGPYAKDGAAQKARQSLADQGFESFIKR